MKQGSWSWVRHSTFATLNKDSGAMTVSLGARGVFTLKRYPSKRIPSPFSEEGWGLFGGGYRDNGN